MKKYKVHHIKCYKPEPTAIHCVTFNENECKLALSRSDNSIAIWDLNGTPYQDEEIVLDKDEGSVEALLWCNNRLFSTGLQGYIMEYDRKNLTIKSKEPVISGPAWCLTLSHDKNLLAAGTENGDICIFTVVPNGIKHLKNLAKQETRILSLSWHKNSFIASGSLDVIKIWNVETGQAIQRMSTGRVNKNQETIVWCIKFLSDFTVVSGDSRGKTCFWNGNTGSLIENIQSHKADVLCIEVDKDENKIYSAGVDPIIAGFDKISTTHNSDGKKKWIRSGTRNIHTHDVRALVFAGYFLASAGVDSYLVLSRYSPKICLKYHQISHKDVVHIANKARCVLFQYNTFLEIWKMGRSDRETGTHEEILPFSSNPMKLLVLKCKSDAKILSSAISEDAQWISYSTNGRIMLYRFSMVDENEFTPKVTLNPVYSLPTECTSARHLSFLPNSERLLVVTCSSELQIITFDTLQGSLHHTFPLVHENVHLLSTSNDGKFAATSNTVSMIQIYDLENLTVHCTLPRYKYEASAIGFQPDTNNLVVVYTDHKIIIFDLVKKEYTNWSRNLMSQLPASWRNQKNAFTNIIFDWKDPNVFILQSDNTLAIIERCDVNQTTINRKYLKVNLENIKGCTSFSQSRNVNVRTCKKYKHLVHFGQIEGDEMLAVELSPSAIFEKLPSALKQKKFGT